MFKKGDYVVHKRTICKVDEIKKNYLGGKDYYSLQPINDDTLKISIPIDSNVLRKPISKKDIEKLLDSIPSIEPIESNERFIENEYRELLKTNNHEDLVKIIKTTYLRNKAREDNNKKISIKDNDFFDLAEEYLYSEIAVSLGLSFDETKKYVLDRVNAVN